MRQQKEESIRRMEFKKQELESQTHQLLQEKEHASQQSMDLEQQKESLHAQASHLKSQMNYLDQNIQQLERQRKDRLHAYGREMPRVIETIQEFTRQRKWKGKPPIGPFGETCLLLLTI